VFLKQMPGTAEGEEHDQVRKQAQEDVNGDNGSDRETDSFGDLVFLHLLNMQVK
jgi:hypothetical protein